MPSLIPKQSGPLQKLPDAGWNSAILRGPWPISVIRRPTDGTNESRHYAFQANRDGLSVFDSRWNMGHQPLSTLKTDLLPRVNKYRDHCF